MIGYNVMKFNLWLLSGLCHMSARNWRGLQQATYRVCCNVVLEALVIIQKDDFGWNSFFELVSETCIEPSFCSYCYAICFKMFISGHFNGILSCNILLCMQIFPPNKRNTEDAIRFQEKKRNIFYKKLKLNNYIALYASLWMPFSYCLKGTSDRFCHSLVLPLAHSQKSAPKATACRTG